MTTPFQPRALDHCVLPVEDLATARARYQALGFTVADDARHPFGTENACVFFADGTYLEPLAVASRETCERTAQKGNQFTARDQTYRFRRGEPGFSALAFATHDADTDHKAFRKAGISAGRKLLFGRTMTDPSGKSGRATFKNAFAADLRAPDAFFFACQRVTMPEIDRSALTRHDNGITGIAGIVASEPNPTDFQYFLHSVVNVRDTQASSFGIEIAAANTALEVVTPEGLSARFGVARDGAERGLRLEGIILQADDAAAFARRAERGGIKARTAGQFVVVDRAPGQGAFLAIDRREPGR